MAVKLSTGCVQSLAQDKTLKEIFHDGVIRLYTGIQPTTADDPVNGTLLVEITKDGQTFVSNTKSVKQKDKVTIGSNAESEIFTIVINEGQSTEETFTYTATASDTTETIANALATQIDFGSKTVYSVSSGNEIIVFARFGGIPYTISTTGSTGTITTSSLEVASRAAGIQWGIAVDGVLYKESGEWKGNAVAAGQATWFRICGNDLDNGAASTTLPRIDGTVGQTSGDLILANTNLAVNDVIIISQAAITIPRQ